MGYVNTRNRGYQTSFRHHQQHHRPVHHNPNNRRQDASKGIRFSHNNINVDASRRNTKKLPPPPPTHFNQIGQNVVRNKPVPKPVPVSNDKSSTNVNAIKTIAAPDLSKYGPGPPVI